MMRGIAGLADRRSHAMFPRSRQGLLRFRWMLSVEEGREPSDDVLLRDSVCGTSSRASTGYDSAEHGYRGPFRRWHEATASALVLRVC